MQSPQSLATKGANITLMNSLNAVNVRTDLPKFKAGDKVVVHSKIKEGNKERVQAYEGVVIARSGTGISQSFTVRRMGAGGIGVERIFPLHSPSIEGIDVKVEGFVRRSKLYYLRELVGKKARIKDRNLKLTEAGAAPARVKKAKKPSKKKAAKAAVEAKTTDSSES